MLKFIVTRYDNYYQFDDCGSFTHPDLTDGKWHHVVLVSDFNSTAYATITSVLYVDGQAVSTITEYANPFSESEVGQASYGTGTMFVMGGSLELGSNNILNGTNMIVDNFRVYDTRLLSSQEVKEIYEAKQ